METTKLIKLAKGEAIAKVNEEQLKEFLADGWKPFEEKKGKPAKAPEDTKASEPKA